MKINKLLSIGVVSATLIACTTNPVTGRRSIQIANNQEIASMALQQYNQVLTESKVIKGTTAANQIRNVGTRLQNAANNYYRSIGRGADLDLFNWEYNLIESSQANAWCMPGGKVAVYTGILPITQNEGGLAVVMGHEISHALAGHGNERISQAQIAQYGGAILGGALSKSQWASVFNQLYPSGAQMALLSYGRRQELEADQMGLYIMAMAGYDPRQAIPFWERMSSATANNSKGRIPAYLATHPSPETRIADIQKNLPKDLEYYKTAGGKI